MEGGDGELESRPVLRMMDPSALEMIRVDWTPGFDANRVKLSSVETD